MKNSGVPLHKLPIRLQALVAAQLWPNTSLPRDLPRNPYPLTLWLDYRVPSLNTLLGKNRFALMRHKAAAREALAATLADFPGYPQNPAGRMHVLVTCYVCQPRDADNPCPKLVIDALRHAGLLRDDDPGAMALTVNPEVKVAKRKLEGTKIVIVPALP